MTRLRYALAAALDRVKRTLEWLDRCGGLGLGKHDRINADLVTIAAALAAHKEKPYQPE